MKIKIIFAVVAAIVLVLLFAYRGEEEMAPTRVENGAYDLPTPKKSAHYESNAPAHASVLPAPPVNVVIDVNFDLASPSSIAILNNGKDYGAGETVIDANKLAMRRAMDYNAPNGLYRVEYKACWPDRSCHTGHFAFAIDRGTVGAFRDLRGQSSVVVTLADIQFAPANIRISRGTRVVWRNTDDVTHYVNTDSHPAHTYYSPQNSRALDRDDSFALVFNAPGFYPYHCSAHAPVMKGGIVVE